MQLAEKRIGRNAVEALLGKVVTAADSFSRDPRLLRRVRSELADAIERVR
jgi:hypothetical protein